MGKHAKLSASGSKRWINCPGSVKLGEDVPRGGSSFFAMQGTGGHSLGDYLLNAGGDAEAEEGMAIYVHDELSTIMVPANSPDFPKYERRCENEGYTRFIVKDDPQEIEPWAVQMFLDKVRGDLEELEAVFGGTIELVTEKYLDMTWLHPLFGGTADANFLAPTNWIHLYDYKHGAGVIVEVEDNTQLIKYAVGILHEYEVKGVKPLGVKMWIVQPRAPHKDGPIRKAEFTYAELKKWERFLVEAADRTQKPNAPFKAGDWCTFCPAIHVCKEAKRHAQEVARMSFDDPPEVLQQPSIAEEMAKLANWAPFLEALIKANDGAISRDLHQGRKVPGWKLVRKKTNRRFGRQEDDELMGYAAGDPIPEDEVVRYMVREGGVDDTEALYHPKELLSLPQMEKLGKEAKKALKALTYKPEGGLTVAREEDARDGVEVEKPDFPDDLDPTS